MEEGKSSIGVSGERKTGGVARGSVERRMRVLKNTMALVSY